MDDKKETEEFRAAVLDFINSSQRTLQQILKELNKLKRYDNDTKQTRRTASIKLRRRSSRLMENQIAIWRELSQIAAQQAKTHEMLTYIHNKIEKHYEEKKIKWF